MNMSYRYPFSEQTVIIKDTHVTEGGQAKVRIQDDKTREAMERVLSEMKILNFQMMLLSNTSVDKEDIDED